MAELGAVVLRHGTVLPMDVGRSVLTDTDVLVVGDRVAAVGVALEERAYRPHLTVGRRGRPAPAALAAYDGPVWTAAEVELVRSTLGRTVDHQVLRAFPLRGSPAAP